ncbi:carbohydrate kinase [Synechococcus sp. CBW1107]|uniref:carbohydrate kinase family protein n=1 Tax=Synechococcus sp. CBW1107 TaxID=2789857 RepID=UPI002AD50609|nr:carbohydrate kinase [Synechococcus sp. CBW1107]CAK6702040.1 Fructokinase [Synechococcus sp. CBW1107]
MDSLPQVLCFGEALVDRLGPPGGDPATDPDCDDRLGGAPANVACALARLGTPVAFLGRLGRDQIGEAFASLLAERGVNRAALQWDPQRPSRIVLVRRDLSGERSFGGFAGDRGEGFADQAIAAAELELALDQLVEPGSAAGPAWLLIGTIPLASPLAAAALGCALARAEARGLRVALDVNWRPTFWGAAADDPPSPRALERIRPLLARADLLKLAAEEAEGLFGTRDPAAIAASLPQAPAVVVTDGGAPLRWHCAGVSGSLAPYGVAVVDSTGAGDAFLAGLLHCLCLQPDLLDSPSADTLTAAMRFASACGALVCGGAGAIDPQPSTEAVQRFLEAWA